MTGLELNLSHLGEKLRFGSYSGFFVPYRFELRGFERVVCGTNFGDHRSLGVYTTGTGETPGTAVYLLRSADTWTVLPDDTPASEEIFDFSQFGCNAGHVRDLISVLDERYQHKEK